MARHIDSAEIDNRFGFHKGNTLTGPQHRALRKKFKEFAEHLNDVLPEGRAKFITFTELERCSMWANKSIAEQAPIVDE